MMMNLFQNLPNAHVIKAIGDLNFHVTPAQVSAYTGISIDDAENELLHLIKICGDGFEIEGEGESERIVLYKFPKSYKLRLGRYSFVLYLNQLYTRWYPQLFKAFRYSFGVFLAFSIAAIVIAWIVILIYTRGNDNNQHSVRFFSHHMFRSGGWTSSDIWMMLWLYRDNPFFIGPNGHHAEYHQHRQDREWREQIAASNQRILYERLQQQEEEEENSPLLELNFLESIFSFLFGDGFPGPTVIQRWSIVAAVIKKYQGCLPAELLLPYVSDGQVKNTTNTSTREEFMLQILARFRGKPVPTLDGKLVYCFPELVSQREGMEDHTIDFSEVSVDLSKLTYFKENLWKFSMATESQRLIAIGLGVFNLFGTFWLRRQLMFHSLASLKGYFILRILKPLSLSLIIYAIGYLIIPVIRYFVITKYWNPAIIKRNQYRVEILDDLELQLHDPSSSLSKKLAFIEKHQIKSFNLEPQKE